MNIRFAIASDLHIALPETIEDKPNRFHLTQFSIPAFDTVLAHLNNLDLDFLLLPGDLTQDGEPENHHWLQEKLASLPYPVYVIPGNHDIPSLKGNKKQIPYDKFPYFYQDCGYQNYTKTLDYTCEITPNLQLVALNSNHFDENGNQRGFLKSSQLLWLEEILGKLKNKLVLLMIHHNVIEHLPQQSKHPLGRRYILDNSWELLEILHKYGVKLIFTGHLHIQDISQHKGIYEVTTGSLITYPSPYRIIELNRHNGQETTVKINSYQVTDLPEKENYDQFCRQWMGDRSYPFIMKLLTSPPLNLKEKQASQYAPHMKYFWADIAKGDSELNYPQLPPEINQHFQRFGVDIIDGTPQFIDNNTVINLGFQ